MKIKKLLSAVIAFSVVFAGMTYPTKYKPINCVNADLSYSDFSEKIAFLVNQEREKEGVAPIKVSDSLSMAASKRADELTELYSHERPDATLCYTILDEYGIKYMAAAENIARGYVSPEDVVAGWMASTKGHRENILNPEYEYLGVGVAYSNGQYYWEQFFTGGVSLNDTHIPQLPDNTTTTTTTTTTTITTTTETTTISSATTTSTSVPDYTGGKIYFDLYNLDMSEGDVLNLNISGTAGDAIQVYFYYADENGDMNADIIGGLGGTVLDSEGNKTVSFTAPNNLDYISGKIVYNFSEPSYTYSVDYKSNPPEPEILKGDATGDGKIDSADVVAVAAYVGNPEKNPLDIQEIANSDVHNTGDGLTANDALMIQQYLAKIITEL